MSNILGTRRGSVHVWFWMGLSLSICVSVASAIDFNGGSGTVEDPYQIATADQLLAITADPNAHYILIADVNLADREFESAPLGNFSGTLDGRGHRIENLTIERERSPFFYNYFGYDIGLFAVLSDSAEVRDLHLVNVYVNVLTETYVGSGLLAGCNKGHINACSSSGSIWGERNVGGLVGNNKGYLDACSSGGAVNGYEYVGGLVGTNEGTISKCSSTASPQWSGALSRNPIINMYDYPVGGLVGKNVKQGRISQSFSTGPVRGINKVGGLVGSNQGIIVQCFSIGPVNGYLELGGLVGYASFSCSISQCYSTGPVDGWGWVGGLIGYLYSGSVSQCYSTGSVDGDFDTGGLIGDGDFEVVFHCLWDVDSSGRRWSEGGIGLAAEQMKDARWYALNGWANDPAWVMPDTAGPPHLAWEQIPGQIIADVEPLFAGQGTAEEPYRLGSASDIVQISKASAYWDDYLVMASDIDLQAHPFSFAVIGNFRGWFDGRGFRIENLVIKGGADLGLFGRIAESAQVRNLGIVDSNVAGWGENIGTLAAVNRGDIRTCYSNGSASGYKYVSCLVGVNVGRISQTYARGSVSGGDIVGGLVGLNGGELLECYSTGEVNVVDIWGHSEWLHNVSFGGLVGLNYGDTFQCFWDITSSGQSQGGGNDLWALFPPRQPKDVEKGLTTSEMINAESYLSQGWDFEGESANGLHETWQMPSEQGYPILSVFAGYTPPMLPGDGTFDSPRQLSTVADLATVFRYPPPGVYSLSNDIDMAGITWSIPPIPLFKGHFDGQGFAIHNLTVQSGSYSGLFGRIGLGGADSVAYGTTVHNLAVVDANVTGHDITGILAGKNSGHIKNCHVTGRVQGRVGVGGLVGWNRGEVVDSNAAADVNAIDHYGVLFGYEGKSYPRERATTVDPGGRSR